MKLLLKPSHLCENLCENLCVRNVFVSHEACSLLSFLRNASDSGGRTDGGGRALGGFSPPREVKVGGGGLSPPNHEESRMRDHLYKLRSCQITAHLLKRKRKYPTL